MKNFVIGLIIGAALIFSGQAFAATLIGSTVDAVIQVKVDGENMGQAPVIDGVSYLPVRKLGTKAGYDVAFGEGIATLTSIDSASIPAEINPDVKAEQDKIDRDNKIVDLEGKKNYTVQQIGYWEDRIIVIQNSIDQINSGGEISQADQSILDKWDTGMENAKKNLTDFQNQLTAIDNQLTELRAQ
jgi:hypothetical protein